MYSPFAPVCVSRCDPFAWLVITTFAAATVAPLGSVTVPRMRPPVLCAEALAEHKIATKARKDTHRKPFHNEVWKDRFDFIEFTPETAKFRICTVTSRLNVPREPYYNPVNLGKAAGDVKRKEFIQAIGFELREQLAAHQRSSQTRGHFFLRLARLGNTGPGNATTYTEPLPPVPGRRRPLAATRSFSAQGPRAQSGRDRSHLETAGRRLRAGGEHNLSRCAISSLAPASRTFARTGGKGHRSFRGLSQRSRTRPDERIHRHVASYRPLLPDQHSFPL